MSHVLPDRVPHVLLCTYVCECLSPLFSPTLWSKTPVVPPRSPRTRVATRQRYANDERESEEEEAVHAYSLTAHDLYKGMENL